MLDVAGASHPASRMPRRLSDLVAVGHDSTVAGSISLATMPDWCCGGRNEEGVAMVASLRLRGGVTGHDRKKRHKGIYVISP
jgi:hypothetical protein